MRLTITLVLIEHQVLDAQYSELVESCFMTGVVLIFAALSFILRDYLLEIRGNDQTRALLVNLGNAIVKRAGSETVRTAARQRLQLLQVRTGGKQIILNPNKERLPLFGRGSRGQRILDE